MNKKYFKTLIDSVVFRLSRLSCLSKVSWHSWTMIKHTRTTTWLLSVPESSNSVNSLPNWIITLSFFVLLYLTEIYFVTVILILILCLFLLLLCVSFLCSLIFWNRIHFFLMVLSSNANAMTSFIRQFLIS